MAPMIAALMIVNWSTTDNKTRDSTPIWLTLQTTTNSISKCSPNSNKCPPTSLLNNSKVQLDNSSRCSRCNHHSNKEQQDTSNRCLRNRCKVSPLDRMESLSSPPSDHWQRLVVNTSTSKCRQSRTSSK